MASFIHDFRYAVRGLTKTPGFTLSVVLTLALGIGANTALYSLINSLLLKNLPVRNPEQLVVLRPGMPPAPQFWSYPLWDQLRRHEELFDGMFAYSNARMNLAPEGEAEFVDSMWVSGGFFKGLDITPVIGRTLSPEDDQQGGGFSGPVAVVSYDFWVRRFNAAPDVIGRTLRLERIPFTIVGVTPRGFFGPTVGRRFDIAMPFAAEPLVRGASSNLSRQNFSWIVIMSRLKPEMSVDAATAAVRSLQPDIRLATLPSDPKAQPSYLTGPFVVLPANTGVSSIRAQYRQPLFIMMATAGMVLLIACANVATLLLTRADARRHETSLRLAMGASRWRIARQWLIESLVLSIVGATLALLLATVFARLLLRELSTSTTNVFLDVSPDWRVLGFAAAAAIVTAMVFGTAPALRASMLDPIDALKAYSRGGHEASGRFNSVLLVAQVALSLVLVAGAALFARSFGALHSVRLGFDPDHLVIATINNTPAQIPTARRLALLRDIQTGIQRAPNVRSAALSAITPFGGSLGNEVEIVGSQRLPEGQRRSATNFVSPKWFGTYGVPLLAGRDFSDGDRKGSPEVVIVNQAFARRFLGEENPVGRLVRDVYVGGKATGTTREIVGLVADTIYASVREEVQPVMYRPLAQLTDMDAEIMLPLVAVTIGTAGPAPAFARNVVNTIRSIDPTLSVTVRPLSAQLAGSLNQDRLLALLSSFFGLLGLLLACIGLYGVTSYGVNRRRGELGIRLALGARPRSVAGLVLRRVAVLVSVGIVAGTALTLWASQFVAPTLVFGVEPGDPFTTASAALVLIAVGALAGWLPARRATRIDPAQVLREA